MKNLLLLTVFACSVFFANAQFTTGQKMIGGNFGLNSGTSTLNTAPGIFQRQLNAHVALSFSKFKSPTLITGAGFNYLYQHIHTNANTTPTNSESHFNTHSFGFFVERIHLIPLANKFYFTYTGLAGANYEFAKSNATFGTINTPSNNNAYHIFASGAIGLLYHLNQRFLFTCNLNNLLYVSYSHVEDKTTNGTVETKASSNQVVFSTGFQNMSLDGLSIGVKYMLKK
ncbi:MAG: hypothetical protein ABI581_17570 [Sediminibacterium sp.]